RWSGWLIATGLPESLTPESAANVLAKLDAAREQLKSIDRDRGRVTQFLAAMRDYEDKVRAITVHWLLESEAGDDVLRVVDDLAVSLGQYDRDAQTQGDLHRQLKDGEERVANLKRRVDATSKSHRESLNAEQRVTEEWNSLLLHIGLETTLTAENARQALQAIERARDQLTVVTDRRAHVESLLQSIGSYRREVLATAAAAGLTTSSADDASHTVSELLVLLEHEDEARRTAVGLVEKVEVADNRLVQLQRKIDERQCAIDELFAEAESVDEKSFRLKAEHFEQRRETQHRIKQCETRLCQLVGSGEALRALQNELQISSPEALSREKHELDEQIQVCEQNHTDAADERGRLKEQLEQLEKTDELSQLRIEEQSARTELETGAVDWSVQKLAAYLIDRAREKYERERRPAVLSEAESFFSRFTGGRYSEIRPSDDGSCVVVRTPDGQTKETDQLSRGTAEQLYLSLRFGFVSEFVRHFEPLPLVFDDILVNFDPVRARAAAEAILELASSQQILFFTCQPATAKLFQELQPDVSTFELKNGNFT
ncbi:MAG: hypothetical protein O3B86_17365, partial [Planctomycetota bacterium]|nr:hypothetical protein [Planctomycetota bacterium]